MQRYRVNSWAVLIVVFASGCAASVQTASRVTYVDESFGQQAIADGGLAILPVLAGAGVEGYRRPFGESINAMADSLFGADDVMHWDVAMNAINAADLSGQYGAAIDTYRQTSILPSSTVLEIGKACKSRYLLVITLNPPTHESELKYGFFTGYHTEETVGVDAYAQVWDAVDGDVVWEGVGAASAKSGEFTYVKETGIETYSRMTAQALIEAILGL
jgi:hypothetical protein